MRMSKSSKPKEAIMLKEVMLKGATMLAAGGMLAGIAGLSMANAVNVTAEETSRILSVLVGHLMGVFAVIGILLVETLPKK
jgi:hypothetical protein